MNIKKILLIFILLAPFMAAQNVIDRIVAVVDNEIICQSELDFQTNLVASQRKIDPNTPGLKEQVLNTLIEEKLSYAQANFDSIIVTDEEVSQRIDYQINYFIQQYGSKENVEQTYGMPIEKIKRELRDNITKSLMIQKLQEKNFGMVKASRREVEEFYNTYKDSLGLIPEKVEISHIYRNPKAAETVKLKFKNKAQAILDSIKAGRDFDEMARLYSEDPGSAEQGGDLGFVKRGVFYPEFEYAAFNLAPGQLSEVVESPVGFHIIQLIEKRGESIHAKHILIKIKNDEDADLNAITFLSDIRDSVLRGLGSFSDYARKYSEDKETVNFGGDLGTLYVDQLDKTMQDIVSKLKDGEISFPKRIEYGAEYGYHIVYLRKRTPQHTADIKTDFAEIERLAGEYKKTKLYKEWIEKLKNKIYWEVRL
ncbi:MAG: peptidylprolyl isomerase [Syntrophothermus sp.]